MLKRARAPAETVSRLRPHFAELGITRLADQTRLDRIGVPCFAAIRPNSRTLSTHHGKGLTPDEARASALMEAVEFAVSEQFPKTDRVSTLAEARATEGVMDFSRFLPAWFDPQKDLHWVRAVNWSDLSVAFIPRDLVVIGRNRYDLPGASRSTGGLASGNSLAEALLHGLCELIERDAITLHRLAPHQRCIPHHNLRALQLSELVEKVGSSGMSLQMFDLTTDIEIPVLKAVISDHAGNRGRHFDVSAGYGCHPDAVQAGIAAITEACQTRISNISGARDDFMPEEYERTLLVEHALEEAAAPFPESTSYGKDGDGYETIFASIAWRIGQLGLGPVIAFERSVQHLGVAVCKVFCEGLEDAVGNRNWRPGVRAMAAAVRTK